jgi:SAM-dependent methyltransferase
MPVMLLDDVPQTQSVAERSLEDAVKKADASGLYLNTVGISDAERRGVLALLDNKSSAVDPVVAFLVSATNGVMYKHVIGKLPRYPIPDFPLSGDGGCLLDIGCNWGRWSISAAKQGWNVVAIDPSLGAVLAARRVARSMHLPIRYVVGDARYLPFEGATFDAVFSYGVLQHLSHQNAQTAVDEISRVLKPLGLCLVQMPNMFGLRSIYQQARRGFRPAIEFEVRYWPIKRLRRLFSTAVGSTHISVDCFGGLGIQKADWDLMTFGRRLVIAGSESARFISRLIPLLLYIADSVYVRSTRSASGGL